MQIIGSPDITNLDAQVTWDISGLMPIISIVNLSLGSGLANMNWWFVATSPTDSPIHKGDADNIDVNGAWTSFQITDSWPKPNYTIEWSGAPYSITIFAKDSNGTISSITKTAFIKKPAGNKDNTRNTYGQANIYIKVLCERGRVLFEDHTSTSYRGIEGVRINALLTMSYPMDDTGTSVTPFRMSPFVNAMVPITFSSENYAFSAFNIYEYDFGDGVKIRIKYYQQRNFPVLCNLDLAELTGSILKLNDDFERGRCEDMQATQKKLTLINSKFSLAIAGKIEPLSDIPVTKLIEEIKQLGGFVCDCYRSSGIIPNSSSIIDGYTFDVVHMGGDINGLITNDGPNVHIGLWDKSYVFAMYPGSPNSSNAYRIRNYNSTYNKTFYLDVDPIILAEEMGTNIKNNAYLVNLWSEIFGNSATFNLVVDGGCIFQSTSTCNYNFVLNNIPASGTFAILSSVKVGSQARNLSFNFNLSNISGLQSYLNSLGIGSFTVTVPSPNLGNDIYIQTLANSNALDALTFKISGNSNVADMAKDCTGYVPISANDVVQKIIYKICNLSDADIQTSQEFIISYIDEGVQKSLVVNEGASLTTVIQALLNSGNTSISHIISNSGAGAVSCDILKLLFKPNVSTPNSTDFIFTTKNGICSATSYLDVFNYVLEQGLTNATTKELFCNFVASCGQGLTCEPFNYIEPFVTAYNTACTSILGIEYTIS